MLRASTFAPPQEENTGAEAGSPDLKLAAIVEGNAAGDSGVPHGEALIELAEAVVSSEEGRIAPARERVAQVLGAGAMVDAVCVVGNFQRMVRIADGTGIPLDDIMLQLSQDFRADLGLEQFHGAANSTKLGVVKRAASGLVRAGMKRTVESGKTPI